ncbi:PIN domain-containing protein [Algoriphagus alkaliphilus]|uniref:PIN domain-containing protein n=1 Tax=Algoriphagus alkaliphilus TaxID=279824 RepID=A0A1G5XDX0_9BACT|nr:PIN domain-containing protein [Algoriphagus alkaliphilus]MBA4300193.1 PIN domain-containing protein [Cyclobacterium sp.]SDA68623.1 PIN domain-containing protein [Algoriphagus alkaliphilus]
MRVFLDANVLVSVLNKEYPLFPNSSRILSLADKPGFELYTSPICLAIAYYFSEKKSGTAMAKKKLEIISTKLKSTLVDQETVRLTASDERVNDFEDGLEYYSALNSACELIITEDKNGFYFSKIPVMNCERFMQERLF